MNSFLFPFRRTAMRARGFTLVEMLVAISITLVMMAAVMRVFVSVTESVGNRRAAVEMGNTLRHARNLLQNDLNHLTCPALPWTKPESNHGYFELIEGPYVDYFPSILTDGTGPLEIDHATSTLPKSNLEYASGSTQAGWSTDGLGLGDGDDALAFTARNEQEPFSGRIPKDALGLPFERWGAENADSPVAEIVWYTVENPASDTSGFYGEPGLRSIYRRVLLVTPWLDFRFRINGRSESRPGLLRILPPNANMQQAFAALIAFQERYDVSARVEFDPTISGGRWTLVANTLADLTKRENRYEHHGLVLNNNQVERRYPYQAVSSGGAVPNGPTFVVDPEYGADNAGGASARFIAVENCIAAYTVDADERGTGNFIRPLVVMGGGATARAVINEQGQVVHLTRGFVPLGRISPLESRRGQDLVASSALAFDVQVFDPTAPVYLMQSNGTLLAQSEINSFTPKNLVDNDLTTVTPGDAGWSEAVSQEQDGANSRVSSGAYVDLGYYLRQQAFRTVLGVPLMPPLNNGPRVSSHFSFRMHGKSGFYEPYSPSVGPNDTTTPPRELCTYRTYDTWNFRYENNGIDDDGDGLTDEGINGFDDLEDYGNGPQALFGADDVMERETSPPYPFPLRGIQVRMRLFEPDSAQMREVAVRQHFVPE